MPPQKKRLLTASEEQFKNALVLDKELARLRRQYTLLVRDRQQLITSSHDFEVQKQKIVAAVLAKEKREVENDLMVATCSTKIKEDKKNSEQLTHLLIEYDYYSEKVKAKQKFDKEIGEQIKLVKKQYIKVSSKMPTDRQYQDRIQYISKVLEKLENKLELQMRRFGEICWDNRKLRLEIDHMMLERANFLKVWNRLIYKLTMGKKYMMDLIEQAYIAYDQREELLQMLHALKTKARHDVIYHVGLMQGYTRRRDQTNNLESFYGIKGQKRLMTHLVENKRLKREERKKNLRETLLRHESIMSKIMEFTMEGNVRTPIAEICKNFVRAEQHNHMNFMFTNDLIAELELIGDRLGYLRMAVDEKRALHEARGQQQYFRIEEMREELEQARNERRESETKLKQCEDDLAIMISGTKNMMHVVRCDTDPMLELLGKNNYINEFNVLLFLQLLARSVNDLVLKFFYQDKQRHHERIIQKRRADESVITIRGVSISAKAKEEKSTSPSLLMIEQIEATNPCPLCVEHEFIGGGDIVNTIFKPWNREEAKIRLKKRLELPGGLNRIHNVSKCLLPKSRAIIQKRYQ